MAAAPLIKIYAPRTVGIYDDWQSTSGDKVQDVTIAGFGRPPDAEPNNLNHFIYLDSDQILQEVLIGLWLDGPIIQSSSFIAPEYTVVGDASIFSNSKPGGGDWTLQDTQRVQLHISDSQNLLDQTFKFFPILVPFIETWNIVRVGFRVKIQSGADLDSRQLRVLYVEKEVSYFVE